MTIDAILNRLCGILAKASGLETCLAYHAVPFASHPDKLLVLELTGQQFGEVFEITDGLAGRLILHLRVSMFLPPETDTAEAHSYFHDGILPALTQEGCIVHSVRTGTPEEHRLYNRMLLCADFDICCLQTVTRGNTT